MERTIDEAVEQEECKRNDYRPAFNVDHLDSDERGRREHYCRNSEANQAG